MPSVLNVDTIADAAGTGPVALTNQSAAKVWINFDGDAAGATVRDSFNVTSTDDDGSGDYGVNFTSSMSNNDYSATGMASLSAFANNDVGVIGPSRDNAAESLATGSIQLDTQKSSNTDAVARDVDAALVTIHGDLA